MNDIRILEQEFGSGLLLFFEASIVEVVASSSTEATSAWASHIEVEVLSTTWATTTATSSSSSRSAHTTTEELGKNIIHIHITHAWATALLLAPYSFLATQVVGASLISVL